MKSIDDFTGDKLREECGVVGVIGSPNAAYYTYLCLYALQHRGQEACGIVSLGENGSPETKRFYTRRAHGLVDEVFNEDRLQELKGEEALGHVRYSTHGEKRESNIQPFSFSGSLGHVAIAHNGNLTNADAIRKRLEEEGSVFRSTVDSEIFIHLLAKNQRDLMEDSIRNVMNEVEGAYSLAILSKEALYAVRDPHGFRPLVIGKKLDEVKDGSGKTKSKEVWFVVSESCALDLLGAELVREVEPGEIVRLAPGKEPVSTFSQTEEEKKPRRFCSFEPIYFSRPDSKHFGLSMYETRKKIGRVLAEENPAQIDVVIAVPDSGVPIAMGYGEQIGKPVEIGLVRNHYIGRTFIQPTQDKREFRVRLKLNAVKSVLAGKSVAVVDDSIVRGTTSVKIIQMLRDAGAKQVHMRIGSPPITNSCYYGVDTPDRSQLMASKYSLEEMRHKLGADSLGFLSQKGLLTALGAPSANSDGKDSSPYCLACFNGDYPTSIGR
jgi:amidophosphoribosyltransferase